MQRGGGPVEEHRRRLQNGAPAQDSTTPSLLAHTASASTRCLTDLLPGRACSHSPILPCPAAAHSSPWCESGSGEALQRSVLRYTQGRSSPGQGRSHGSTHGVPMEGAGERHGAATQWGTETHPRYLRCPCPKRGAGGQLGSSDVTLLLLFSEGHEEPVPPGKPGSHCPLGLWGAAGGSSCYSGSLGAPGCLPGLGVLGSPGMGSMFMACLWLEDTRSNAWAV